MSSTFYIYTCFIQYISTKDLKAEPWGSKEDALWSGFSLHNAVWGTAWLLVGFFGRMCADGEERRVDLESMGKETAATEVLTREMQTWLASASWVRSSGQTLPIGGVPCHKEAAKPSCYLVPRRAGPAVVDSTWRPLLTPPLSRRKNTLGTIGTFEIFIRNTCWKSVWHHSESQAEDRCPPSCSLLLNWQEGHSPAHEREMGFESGCCKEVKKCRSGEFVKFRHLELHNDFGFCQVFILWAVPQKS